MKKKVFQYINLLLIICLIIMTAVGCGGKDAQSSGGERETITLKIGGGHMVNGMAYTQVAQEFFQAEISKRCAEETNYDVEWIEAYGGTIAKLPEGLTACQNGLLDVLVNSYAFENAKLFLMNMNYYVPFSSTDPTIVTKASRMVMDEYADVYEDLWATYNQKFLALGPTGAYELITNFPVNSLADLKGHKIAAAGANLPWLEGTGAIPVQSNLNEAYTSIQTGVYDGWIMWPDASYRYKLHEVAPYFTAIGFGADAIQGISINLDVWNSLPEEVQAIMEEVAAEYEVKSAEAAKELDVTSLEAMQKEGLTICEMPKEDIEKWAAGLPNIPQVRASEAEGMGFPGIEIWNAYIDAQKQLGHTFARDWIVQ
ncbi:C4-dicarboxylate TRAP transporter substrate-binding protein [Sinanaerobacter chloroacetimidivorans]|jgi:TRAP-type C4-dicarboxylate transport system substrate-binding protein|uniref:C4-dicarboxylate TRAP transporter substrate-binding protein n=1 Tax=Sinanaerobacter chloroacetimidivorans TaxID=2818044 RepID=A0A8J8B2Q0_9FIRM|nr:C4-dicarboxylate TRAP transporter substrate-binding protein [Sinanaerobacter chloroacetimidivorans]MBR0597460.1 C4-dicarboxylate TRAP transporter substrate-binding protein [Sinanaerobacter chloroacetimidivorans]